MNKQNVLLNFENFSNSQKNKMKSSCELAEFLGWHIGDGCVSINNRYSEYTLTGDLIEEYPFYNNVILPTFKKLFSNYVKKEIKLKEYKSNGVCGIYIFDKNFVRFLQKNFGLKSGKKINISIPNIIKTDEQKISFLRGLFDTDGSIYYCKSNFKTVNESWYTKFHYKSKIKLATISKPLIDQVYQLLCDLGFSPRIRKPAKQKINENMMYGVVLYRKDDTQRWIEEIGFKNPKHQTKVQIWKKFGFCPPKTTLKQRIKMLKGELEPLTFYPGYSLLNYSKIVNYK
jgi:hypothetical protein